MQKKHTCCFCKSEKNKTFSKIVLETEHFYVVQDNFPVTKGHLLIISKEHYPTWFDARREVQNDLVEVLNQSKKWLSEHFKPEGFNVGFNCGAASGQTIPHLHVHVIPRYQGDCLNPEGGIRGVIPQKQKYLSNLI